MLPSHLPAGVAWQANAVDHGWYFAVEPFTGMTIEGHKVGGGWWVVGAGRWALGGAAVRALPSPQNILQNIPLFNWTQTLQSLLPQGYQFNHLVQRTDELYPSLWVAPGSAASPLGAAMGMDADFVTGGRQLVGSQLFVGLQLMLSAVAVWRGCSVRGARVLGGPLPLCGGLATAAQRGAASSCTPACIPQHARIH